MQASHLQHTVKNSFSITGAGFHTGESVTITVKPAQENTGITFMRTDIADRDNVVPARWENVKETQLRTLIANEAGASVSTTEHLMYAFAALGVDNAVVEINGPELPILDGSATGFVKAIEKAGLQQQKANRQVLRIKKKIAYKEGDKEVTLKPARKTRFSYKIAFNSAAIGKQKFKAQKKNLKMDITNARTFGFQEQAKDLQKQGLTLGRTQATAIIIDGDDVLNPEGLRFKDEFVRHKILDAVGDLYLAGMPLLGHYHGVKAGHDMNYKALVALFSRPDAYEIVELGKNPAKPKLKKLSR
jgi:UDP-3-O-[3-hydroxymyristoyl] N-acetylglucosamine deacetylase